MVTTGSEWVADVVTMTCKNTTNKIIVKFEKLDKTLNGKIIDAPLKIINEWVVEKKIEEQIRNTVTEAEKIFLMAYGKEDGKNVMIN